MKTSYPKFKLIAQRFLSLSTGLLILILLMRLYELRLIVKENQFPVGSWKIELQGILYDFFFFIKISAILSIPFFLFYLVKPSLAKGFYVFSGILLVAASYGLSLYFSVAKIPFGAELFGYNFGEMCATVISAGFLNATTIILGVIFIGVAVTILLRSEKFLPGGGSAKFFCIALFPGLFLLSFVQPVEKRYKAIFQSFLATNKVLFFMDSSILYYKNNFTSHNLVKIQYDAKSKQNIYKEEFEYVSSEYPFLHKENSADVLGTFFNKKENPPNLVFIIVEGLGRAYSGKGAYLGSFTPFLDSLSGHSLYWENMLSTSGRTFSVLPSVLGSLPFGQNGFAEMGEKMPSHFTLLQLLKERGYTTSFYCGTDPHFDNIDVFLRRQNIDNIIGIKQYGPEYIKLPSEADFSWGYGDKEIFKKFVKDQTLQHFDRRMDVILTIATHNPFLVPDEQVYLNKFNARLKSLNIKVDQKKFNSQYAKEFASILYFDDALRDLIQSYKNLPAFDNTVFVITGDHRMPEIPISTQLDRFHVPLIIYSPLLKEAKTFKSISSHFDITPSFTAFLRENYQISFPVLSAWIGHGLDTGAVFRSRRSYPLMRNKSEFIDFIEGDNFLSGNTLYKVYPSMDIEPSEDENRFEQLDKHFEQFRRKSVLACKNNKLIPDSLMKKRSFSNN